VRAVFGNECQLRLRLLRFRVAAPKTAQWAPLEKDSGANARPIVKRKPLNVKDHSLRGWNIRWFHHGLQVYAIMARVSIRKCARQKIEWKNRTWIVHVKGETEKEAANHLAGAEKISHETL
jgi:hypothetical protein